MVKGATIHFLAIWSRILFKHQCSLLICETECIKLNWLCKHMKMIRSSQPYISINPFTELIDGKYYKNLGTRVISNFIGSEFRQVTMKNRQTNFLLESRCLDTVWRHQSRSAKICFPQIWLNYTSLESLWETKQHFIKNYALKTNS